VNEEFFIHLPLKMEPTEGSETSAFRTQTPGNYLKENILHINYLIYKFQPDLVMNNIRPVRTLTHHFFRSTSVFSSHLIIDPLILPFFIIFTYEISILLYHVFLILIAVITCACCDLVTVLISKKQQIAVIKHEEGKVHVNGKVICC